MSGDSSSTWPSVQIKPFLDYIFSECGLAVNTVLAYKRDLRRFNQFCRQQQLDHPNNLKPLDVQNFARDLFQLHLSTSTIARHLVTVRMFMRFHLLNRMVDHDICSLLETPKTWQRLPRVLSKQQTITLIESVDPDDPLFLRNRALLELLYATGMRASELADLELAGVNFQIGFIRCIGKGRKERVLPLWKSTAKTLSKWIAGNQLREGEVLFPNARRSPLTRSGVEKRLRNAVKKAGETCPSLKSKRISPHTLRHTTAMHLLQSGVDITLIAMWLGHESIETTHIYMTTDLRMKEEALKSLQPPSGGDFRFRPTATLMTFLESL